MPLDPNIFFRGAELRRAREADTQNLFDKLTKTLSDMPKEEMARKLNEQNLSTAQTEQEYKRAQLKQLVDHPDLKKAAESAVLKMQSGQEPSQQEIAALKTWDTFNQAQNALNPATGEPYAKNKSVFDVMGNMPRTAYKPSYPAFGDGVGASQPMMGKPEPVGDVQSAPVNGPPADAIMGAEAIPQLDETALGQPSTFDSLASTMRQQGPSDGIRIDGAASAPSYQLPDPVNTKQAQEVFKTKLDIAKDTALEDKKASFEQEKRTTGKQDFEKVLSSISKDLTLLNDEKGITSEKRGAISNIKSYTASTDVGQEIAKGLGTKEQTLRDSIANKKKLLSRAIMQATGMSAKQMDSNAELKMFMDSLGSSTATYEANSKTLRDLSEYYGSGRLMQDLERGKSGGSGKAIRFEDLP